jgi:hypothetical protein
VLSGTVDEWRGPRGGALFWSGSVISTRLDAFMTVSRCRGNKDNTILTNYVYDDILHSYPQSRGTLYGS